MVVCLGATAARSLLGGKFRLTHHHGEFLSIPQKPPITATIHPSAVLRAPTDEDRHSMMEQLVDDLKAVAHRLRRRACA